MYCCLSSDNKCNSWKQRGELSPGTGSSKHQHFGRGPSNVHSAIRTRQGWLSLLGRQIRTVFFLEYCDKYHHQITPVSQTHPDPLLWDGFILRALNSRLPDLILSPDNSGSPFAIFLLIKSKGMTKIPLQGSP